MINKIIYLVNDYLNKFKINYMFFNGIHYMLSTYNYKMRKQCDRSKYQDREADVYES